MYGTFNLTNLFQENFVLLWSLGVFGGGRKKNPKGWEKPAMHKTVHKATPTQTLWPSGLPAAEALRLGG